MTFTGVGSIALLGSVFISDDWFLGLPFTQNFDDIVLGNRVSNQHPADGKRCDAKPNIETPIRSCQIYDRHDRQDKPKDVMPSLSVDAQLFDMHAPTFFVFGGGATETPADK